MTMLSWKVKEEGFALGDIPIFLAIIALIVLLSLSLFSTGASATTAQVQVDGTVIQTLDLTQNGTVTLTDLPYPLTLDIQDGAISISHADCPGEDCIATGWISYQGQQIICLPNRLVISLLDGQTLPFDATLG